MHLHFNSKMSFIQVRQKSIKSFRSFFLPFFAMQYYSYACGHPWFCLLVHVLCWWWCMGLCVFVYFVFIFSFNLLFKFLTWWARPVFPLCTIDLSCSFEQSGKPRSSVIWLADTDTHKKTCTIWLFPELILKPTVLGPALVSENELN